jgi:FkbM family methyltransferase
MLIPIKEVLQDYQIKATGVLHIGASTGQELEAYYANGITRSVWIEANPALITVLTENCAKYPDAIVINACISDVDGQDVELNISNNEGQSSSMLELEYHKVAHPEVVYVDKIPVKTQRMDTVIIGNDININKYKFLNIDIQGAELLALKGMSTFLFNFECIYIEVNEKELYKGNPLVGELDEYLDKYDFVRVKTEMCGDFGWGDAVYIKKDKAAELSLNKAPEATAGGFMQADNTSIIATPVGGVTTVPTPSHEVVSTVVVSAPGGVLGNAIPQDNGFYNVAAPKSIGVEQERKPLDDLKDNLSELSEGDLMNLSSTMEAFANLLKEQKSKRDKRRVAFDDDRLKEEIAEVLYTKIFDGYERSKFNAVDFKFICKKATRELIELISSYKQNI